MYGCLYGGGVYPQSHTCTLWGSTHMFQFIVKSPYRGFVWGFEKWCQEYGIFRKYFFSNMKKSLLKKVNNFEKTTLFENWRFQCSQLRMTGTVRKTFPCEIYIWVEFCDLPIWSPNAFGDHMGRSQNSTQIYISHGNVFRTVPVIRNCEHWNRQFSKRVVFSKLFTFFNKDFFILEKKYLRKIPYSWHHFSKPHTKPRYGDLTINWNMWVEPHKVHVWDCG